MSGGHHARLKELFLEACELDPGELPAYLERVCAGDGELRAELEAMLEADRREQGYLRQVPSMELRSLSPGVLLDGKFEIQDLLGEGGLGEVWRAEQLEPVRRPVAVKLVKPGLDTRQVIARFEVERQTLAILDHPCIAKVLDAGLLDDGRPYFVMEYIDGVPITTYADEQGLDLRARLDLFLELCDAAQHAHQKGVIHRDVKPSNVLVGMLDGRPVPKIIDFGIAKAVEGSGSVQALHTLEHQVIGTPAYMSPEQAVGARDIDTRTDVYSLGVLLYELLTGATPFDAERLRESSFLEIVRMIQEEEAPRPSVRAAGERRKPGTGRPRPEQLRGDLDWIVLRALEKERERRYASAEALASDLRRHLDHRPVLASPPSAAYRVSKFVRRNRTLVASLVVIFAALIGGILSTTHARDKERVARLEAEDSLEEAQLVTDFLADLFRAAGPEMEGIDVRVIDILDRSAEEIGRQFEDRPRVQARLHYTIGLTYRRLGQFSPAEALLEEAVELAREHYPPKHPFLLTALSSLSILYDEQRRFDASEPLHRELLELQEEVFGPNSRRTLGFQCNFGLFLYDQERFEEAEVQLRRTLERMREHIDPTDTYVMNCTLGLGNALSELGRYDEARALFEEVERSNGALRGAEHPQTIYAVANLAGLTYSEGDVQRAVEQLDEVLRRCAIAFPPDHWRIGDTAALRAEWLRELGRLQEAATGYARAHPILEGAYGPEDGQAQQVVQALIELHEELGNEDQAAHWRTKARKQ